MRFIKIEEVENGYVITSTWSVNGKREHMKEIAHSFPEVIRAVIGWDYGIDVFYNDEKLSVVEEKILEMLRSVE